MILNKIVEAEIGEFSLAAEISKLQKMLTLPITNVIFDEKYEYGKLYIDNDQNLTIIYAKLFTNDSFIGTIPYMSDKWGPMYDTSKQKELDWGKIYNLFEQEIFTLVRQQQPQAVSAEIRDYKTLFVKDNEDQLINFAFCNYIDNAWQVVVSSLDAVEIYKEVKIIIQASIPTASNA